ncbi:hypothetical protein [Candidatus Villigracilis saccharophilus]|uniref:hypothetical protein n=1 Tax=Candidatus Villigracilis saccharophilus TaxID=3140684 RepID=UPI003135B735|nr:hypothetical protein [Anaerolineales bacterium]
MILNTLTKKSVLAIFIACGGVIWLNEWHQYGYSSTELIFPSVSSWLRDSMIVLIPVLLAVWFGLRLAQWIIDRIDHKLSPSTQAILAATLLGGATSLAFLLIENNQIILTGISTELAFIVSICRNLYSDGNFLLSALLWAFPGYLATRYHILLQDGFYLALVNMTITIFLMFILEGVAGVGNSRNHKKRV